MKVFVLFNNNHMDYEDYEEWIDGIFFSREKAERRKLEIIQTELGCLVEPARNEEITVDGDERFYCPLRIEEHTVE